MVPLLIPAITLYNADCKMTAGANSGANTGVLSLIFCKIHLFLLTTITVFAILFLSAQQHRSHIMNTPFGSFPVVESVEKQRHNEAAYRIKLLSFAAAIIATITAMLIAPFNTDAIFTATFVVLTSASISVACRRHYKWSIIEESERAGGESSTPDRLNDLILLTALLSVVGGFILLAEVMTTLPAGRDMSYTVFTAGISTITSTATLFVLGIVAISRTKPRA